MEITGTGWKDELYTPDNMWMDIRASWMTENVYEAMFDFGPALKGMMLISTDKGTLTVHSRIMDTMDFAEPEEEEDSRFAFLQGFLYAMKRLKKSDEHEAAFAAHRSPSYRTRENRPNPLPTRYTVLLRGSHRVPEWADDFIDTNTDEKNGILDFKDSEVCEFDMSCMCDRFKGVPTLSSQDGRIKGFKVSDWPQHEWVVPQPDKPAERMLEMTRDNLNPSRKRKRADWGSLRDYRMDMDFYMLHSVGSDL